MSWREEAKCSRSDDPEQWFKLLKGCPGKDDDPDVVVVHHPNNSVGNTLDSRNRARAAELCDGCPVINECRQAGLAEHEPYGIWGGLTSKDLIALKVLR